MSRLLAAIPAIAAAAVLAAQPPSITAFSAQPPGALVEPWHPITLKDVSPAELALVADEGGTVLRVRSIGGAGTAAHAVDASPRGLALAWRWKIDRVVQGADMTRKSGDDFAARVYVFFDVPAHEVPWAARLKLAAMRLIYGKDLPTAGLCYVWDNRHAAGTTQWNPYTDRVRTVVLRSGADEAGHWKAERRDLEADYRAAFGAAGELPRVSGIAAGNDTDQTGERATAWFGDFRLEPRP